MGSIAFRFNLLAKLSGLFFVLLCMIGTAFINLDHQPKTHFAPITAEVIEEGKVEPLKFARLTSRRAGVSQTSSVRQLIRFSGILENLNFVNSSHPVIQRFYPLLVVCSWENLLQGSIRSQAP